MDTLPNPSWVSCGLFILVPRHSFSKLRKAAGRAHGTHAQTAPQGADDADVVSCQAKPSYLSYFSSNSSLCDVFGTSLELSHALELYVKSITEAPRAVPEGFLAKRMTRNQNFSSTSRTRRCATSLPCKDTLLLPGEKGGNQAKSTSETL